MNTKRERIGDFRELLSRLAQVPKDELNRELEKADQRRKAMTPDKIRKMVAEVDAENQAKKHKKKAGKRKKRS